MCMVCALARLWWIGIYLVTCNNCSGSQRTFMASSSQEAQKTRSELCAGTFSQSFGAEGKEKRLCQVGESSYSSQLERCRVPSLNTSNCQQYDLVLPILPSTKRAQIRKMSFMRSPLVSVLGCQEDPQIKIEEPEEEQECAEGARLGRQAVKRRSPRWRVDGHFSNSSSLDSIYPTSKAACSEESGKTRGRSDGIAVAAATCASTAASDPSAFTLRDNSGDDCGRDKSFGTHESCSGNGPFYNSGVHQAAPGIGAEGKGCNLGQMFDTWPHQQIESAEVAGVSGRQEDFCGRRGMAEVCDPHPRKDSVSCGHVSATSSTTLGCVSGETVRTGRIQEGSQCCIHEPLGSTKHWSRQCGAGDALGISMPGTGCRSARSNGGSYQPSCAGRGSSADGNGSAGQRRRGGIGHRPQGCEACPKSEASAPSAKISAWGVATTSQGQDRERWKGWKGEQRDIEHVDQTWNDMDWNDRVCADAMFDLDKYFEQKFPWSPADACVHSPCTAFSDASIPPFVDVMPPAKVVSFKEDVEIIAFHKHEHVEAKVPIDCVHQWLRAFWCLEGQGSSWTGIELAFRNLWDGRVPWIQFAMRDGSEPNAERSPNANLMSTPNDQTEGSELSIDIGDSPTQTVLEDAIVKAGKVAQRFRRASVVTWFLANNRFHVGMASRTLQVDPGWDVEGFRRECRRLWQDLIVEEDLTWHVVQPSPHEMPGVCFHVIIVEGKQDDQAASLLHCEALPCLRRYRAVLFTNGVVAHTLVRVAQLSTVCNRGMFRCVLRIGQADPIQEFQEVHVQFSTVISAMVMEFEDDTESSHGSDSSHMSEISTAVESESTVGLHDGSTLDDGWVSGDDEVSFMSASLPYNALQPFLQQEEHPHEPNTNPQELVEPEEVVQILASQLPAITEIHGQVVQQSTPGHFRLITFGLGLVHLGRREALIQSDSLDTMFQVLDDLWQDHAQFAPLHAFIVQDQPDLQCLEPCIVFLVEVQYLPLAHPLRSCPVLVQEHGDEEMMQNPDIYAAWVGRNANTRTVMADLQRDQLIIPHGVRTIKMMSRGISMSHDQQHRLEDGDFIQIEFDKYPQEVTVAEGHVFNAVRMFIDIGRHLEQQPQRTVVCRFSGVSPGNRPLGERDLVLSIDSLRAGDWYDQARHLWPFEPSSGQLVYATIVDVAPEGTPRKQFVLQFIVNHHHVPGKVPILVTQTLFAVEDRATHSQTWAVNVPQTANKDDLIEHLYHPVFWKVQDRRTHVHSGWNAGEVVVGAVFDLMSYTHRKDNILMFLLQDAERLDEMPEQETTSLLQITRRDKFEIEVFQEIMAAVSRSAAHNQDGEYEPTHSIPGQEESCPYIGANEVDSPGEFLGTGFIPDKEIQFCLSAFQSGEDQCIPKSKQEPVTLCLEAVIPCKHDSAVDREFLSFQWFDRRNWFDFAISQNPVPLHALPEGLKIKPSSYHALTCQRDWIATPSTYMVFVDGASDGQRASWSVVVVATDGWVQSFVGCACGRVQTNPNDLNWYGADAEDNISGELTAFLHAQNWIFKRNDHGHYVVCPDLLLSKLLADHKSLSRAHPTLAKLVRAYSDWIDDRMVCQHVKGHQGFAWNELADSLAGHALKQTDDDMCPPITDMHSLAGSTDDLNWVWMQDSTAAIASCFPPLEDEQAACVRPSMRRVAFSSEVNTGKDQYHRLELIAITANVLAMDPKHECDSLGRQNAARTVRLDQQWHEDGVHVAGLQEARTDAGRFQSEHYHIISSGADRSHTACLGCELWFHKTKPIMWDDANTPVMLNHGSLVVQHADPRRLFVRFTFAEQALNFLVLHAPCRKVEGTQESESDTDTIENWWLETSQMCFKLLEGGMTMVLVDANAPLASSSTDRWGLEGAESMNHQGECFEQFIEKHDLFAPSTMAWCHTGPHATWTHPRGASLRRDYPLVCRNLFSMTQSTRVLTKHDTTFAHADHVPVLVECQGWVKGEAVEIPFRWDYEAMKDPVRCQAFQEALRTLPVPAWSVHVDDHCKIFEHQLLQLGKQFFAKTSKKRNRPQLSVTTLQAIAFKRSCLDWARNTGQITDPGIKLEIKDLEKEICKMVWKDSQVFFQHLLDDLEEAAGLADFKQVYNLLARFGSRKIKQIAKGRPLPLLKNQNGQFAKTFQEQQKIWRKQFAHIEAGEEVSWDVLQGLNKTGLGLPAGMHDLDVFPTEFDTSKAIHALRRGKVPGPNAIPPDLLKAGNNVVAKQLTTLFVKSAAHGHEPLSWKGGYLAPLHKKGPPADPGSYRSIFVSDFTAKLYHVSMRRQLVDAWTSALSHLQLGGRPKTGTDLAHFWLQAHAGWARFHKLGHGAVFFDLKSAFYMVLRQTITDIPDANHAAQAALIRLGVRPDEVVKLFDKAKTETAAKGLTPHAMLALKDILTNTFFLTRGSDQPTKTNRGTRPGDPVGDVLFNLVMALILAEAVGEVRDTTGAAWLGSVEACSSFESVATIPCPGFIDVSYVDDCVFVIHGHSNDEVEQIAVQIVTAMCKSAETRGLMINFEPGKTEMVWKIQGPGSRAKKQQLAEKGQALVWQDQEVERALRVVSAYKHLGTWFQQGSQHLKEVRARGASAVASWGPLSRSFYAKRSVADHTKTQVFGALTMSRLLYNAHVWTDVSGRQLEIWQNSLRRPLYSLVKGKLFGLPPFQFDVMTLSGIAKLLPPCDALHAARLRFIKRLLDSCQPTLWAMIWDQRSMDQSWVALLTDSFRWLQTFCPAKMPVSAESTLLDWIAFVQLDPAWKGKVRAAIRSCKTYRHEAAKQLVWQAQFDRFLAEHGVPEQPQTEEQGGPKWECDLCQMRFESKRALAMHSHKVHKYRALVRYYASGDTCQACCKWYHCRERLRTHLTTSEKCLQNLIACLPPFPEEKADLLDQEDRERGRLLRKDGWWPTKAFLPVLKIYGPTLPPSDCEGAGIMYQKVLSRQHVTGDGFQNLQGRQIAEEVEEQLPWWKTVALPAVVMQSQGGCLDGDGRLADAGLAKLYGRLHIKALAFVHFFSGYRRSGDLHQVLDEISIAAGVQLFIISVDICMQRELGDLGAESAIKFWTARIKSGQLVGAGGGPLARPTQLPDTKKGAPPQ